MTVLRQRADELLALLEHQRAFETALLTEEATRSYAYEVCEVVTSLGYPLPAVLTVRELAERVASILEQDSLAKRGEVPASSDSRPLGLRAKLFLKQAKHKLYGAAHNAMKLMPAEVHNAARKYYARKEDEAGSRGDHKAAANARRRYAFHLKHGDPELHKQSQAAADRSRRGQNWGSQGQFEREPGTGSMVWKDTTPERGQVRLGSRKDSREREAARKRTWNTPGARSMDASFDVMRQNYRRKKLQPFLDKINAARTKIGMLKTRAGQVAAQATKAIQPTAARAADADATGNVPVKDLLNK